MRLDAGSYDLSALPLVTGSNDVEIRVRDDAGGVQNVAYRSYLDPIDLQPGDYEYSAYIGRTSQRFGRTPTYGGPLSFTGFYRKAFLDKPALGVGQGTVRLLAGDDLVLEFAIVRRRLHPPDAKSRTGFVDQIDRLIRQEASMKISI